MIPLNSVLNEDCLGPNGMCLIPDKSIDMILCDLPYGTTACKWDAILPFAQLWSHYERVIKDNGAIVLTASQPFTTELIQSNRKLFKYSLVWDKKFCGSFALAKVRPMITHEDVLVFGKGKVAYYPQMVKREEPIREGGKKKAAAIPMPNFEKRNKVYDEKYPVSILDFPRDVGRTIHPTQKPVELFEYLTRTYTCEGETVLDNCMGSGTTAIACINTGRNYIGFEKEEKYYHLIQERIRKHAPQKELDFSPL